MHMLMHREIKTSTLSRAGRGHTSLNPISSQSLTVLFIYLVLHTPQVFTQRPARSWSLARPKQPAKTSGQRLRVPPTPARTDRSRSSATAPVDRARSSIRTRCPLVDSEEETGS